MKRAHFATVATVVAVAATLLLAGCSASGSSESESGRDSVAEPAPADGAFDAGGESADEAAGGKAPSVESRDVVTTGTMSVTADDPVQAAGEAAALVDAADGRVDSQNEQPGTDSQPARASLVIRVPADRYTELVADVEKLGDVTGYATEATDVTQQKQDIDARISALETSTKRLESLMADADSTADLIEIENALSGRQAELDSLTTQRDYLADQVAFSTLSVDFTAPGVVSPGSPRTFWDGFLAGWNALVAFLAGTLVVIGAFLPWLLLVAAIAAIVLLIVRMSRRGLRTPQPADGQAGAPDQPAPEPASVAEADAVDSRA
ncbi:MULTISPECIES: DUF4349 domain-containing protein [unclassified Leifsonia]|uniref:DUF4349 domain-containing protein n=1 Tax=unclassified Leifsonia TaxID=2663824 RepID=UPI0006F361AE|nr:MULTISPECIES: DUF4349 domain-containing protein [unclassified Leifsonia]KQX07549.1 hypothetical protein ASC59_07350 [Leifsonia sp. Root1293]KRA11831.1 hypothetical protein ASD61_07350 [Leifsonia sp. Root60]